MENLLRTKVSGMVVCRQRMRLNPLAAGLFQPLDADLPCDGVKGVPFDLDLIDMTEPASHAYRGMVPYRLTDEEKGKYWGKAARKFVKVAVHEIGQSQRGPYLRGEILSLGDKP